jgi:hypothetical protein
MKYKTLDSLDYSNPENYLGIIYLNGHTSGGFRKANAIEGWVETWIQKTDFDAKLPDYLRDENNKPISVTLRGNVVIEALDKKGQKILLEDEEQENECK